MRRPPAGVWIRRPGELVTWRGRSGLRLDGFYAPAPPGAPAELPLVIFVHGMFSNFYRSPLKAAFLEELPRAGLPILSINNRGADAGTTSEVFEACEHDLDAAASFARRIGRRRVAVIGHSTGCQKALHWADRRRGRGLAAIVLLAPCDDYAIVRRDLGARWQATLARARAMVRAGRGDEVLIARDPMRFTARRFLSLADPRRREAALFRYDGPMRAFRRLRVPVFAAFGDHEPYAVSPVAEMLARLRALRPGDVQTARIPGADHSFAPRQRQVARLVARWLLLTAAARARNRPAL
ncbi:MAG: alpha/beta fold hydrolase [Kiritimatiellae bacterium]|nr:alpha/beta fold hydrolase [Kiritimatiellia bacterium]